MDDDTLNAAIEHWFDIRLLADCVDVVVVLNISVVHVLGTIHKSTHAEGMACSSTSNNYMYYSRWPSNHTQQEAHRS